MITKAYRGEMDALGRFLDDCCIVEAKCTTPATPLFELYTTWCKLNGEEPMTQTKFGRQLGERGFESDREEKTRRSCWKGIGIRKSEDSE